MNKEQRIASQVLKLVGEKENISHVFHCMTRLRFNLKDNGLANLEKIKEVEGVYGVQIAEGELQIIIGAGVNSVYNAVLDLTGLEETESIDEDLDGILPENKQKKNIKWFINGIFSVFSSCLSPLVPLFVAIGIFNMIAVLIGPQFLNLVGEESDIYRNFYWVGQTILYFLPVLVGYTASRKFGSNTLITVVLACMLIYPDFVSLVGKGASYTVYGIPAAAIEYSSSLIPIMLIAWIQKYIEKFLNKYIPDVIKVILIPCGTIAIMLPLSFCILGPIGNYLGVGLGNLIFGLYDIAGPLETTLFGAFCVILTGTGISRPIFFIAMTTLFAAGQESAVMPIAMVINNFIVMGLDLGYIIKTKSAKKKQFGITCFISSVLGGVSEPSIFGIIFNNKRAMLTTIIAGAISGLYLGIMNVTYYSFGPSNILGVVGFFGGTQMNFIHGCIAAGIGFIAALIVMLLIYHDEKNK